MIKHTIQLGNPFNLGIDFTGGTTVLLNVDSAKKAFQETKDLPVKLRDEIRGSITAVLQDNGISHVQYTTVDKRYFLVRTTVIPKDKLDKIMKID